MPTLKDDGESFAALKQPAVEALARILYFKHAITTSKTNAACDSWLKLQYRQIDKLHEASIRRQGTLSLMADVFIRGAFTKPQEVLQAQNTAALCRHHRELSPHVLSALMALVTEESTVRANQIREHLQRKKKQKPPQAEDDSDEAVEHWLRSMSRIAVLWMGKARWEGEMRRPLDFSVPPCVRHNDCAACKLAVVGGSRQFLMDLRTSLLARWHEHDAKGKRNAAAPKPPLLLRMVEAWIDVCYDEKRRDLIRSESDLLAGVVARLRGVAEMSGGSVAGQRGGDDREEGSNYMRSGWPMPLMKLRAMDVEKDVGEEGEREDGGNFNDVEYVEEDGYVAGHWRRKQKTGMKEGYSQYLTESLLVRPNDFIDTTGAVVNFGREPDEVSSAAASHPSVSVYDVPEDDDDCDDYHDAHVGHDNYDNIRSFWTTNDHNLPAPCMPLQPIPPPHRRRTQIEVAEPAARDTTSLDVSAEPWEADYKQFVLNGHRPSFGEHPLSTMRKGYHDADEGASATSNSSVRSDAASASTGTSLHAPSSLFTRSMSGIPAAVSSLCAQSMPGVPAAASSPSASEYSPAEEEEEHSAMRGRGRDDTPSTPPPPLPPRARPPRSGIPVLRGTGGRPPLAAAARDSAHSAYSVSSTALLGNGDGRGQRRPNFKGMGFDRFGRRD